MRRTIKRFSGVLLVFALIVSFVGTVPAPTYAGGEEGPVILVQTHDRWVPVGEPVITVLDLDRSVNNVALFHWSQAIDDWEWHDTCIPQDSATRTTWHCEVDPNHWSEPYISLKFVINYDGGYMYSEEFRIEWTDDMRIDRIAGEDRYKTAGEIAYWTRFMSGGALSKYPNVIIACGTDYADALGGAYLSYCYDAPILLVNDSQAVMDQAVQEIMSNMVDGGTIFILGGKGAVPGKMEERLAAGSFYQSQIKRFAGLNRYDTNMQILEYCGVYKDDILVCSGLDFPDALSASSVGLPILLVGNSMTEEQLDRLGSMKPTSLTLIGGTGAVSSSVEGQLSGRFADVSRIAGMNRYETSAKVARRYFYQRQRFFITLAYGQDFPDGLAGGPFCLSLRPGAPLALADNSHYKDAELTAYMVGARHAFILGGPTLISDDVAMKKILEHPDYD